MGGTCRANFPGEFWRGSLGGFLGPLVLGKARTKKTAKNPRQNSISGWECSVLKILGSSAVKQRGRERKGPPEIVQKYRLRNWPISSADFPSRLLWKGQSTILALLRRRILGQYPAAPCSPGPIWFTADFCLVCGGGGSLAHF